MSEVISKVYISEDWNIDKSSDNIFSSDEVIDAYFRGKKDGLKSHQQSLLDSLNNNVDSCAKHSYEVITHLKEKGFENTSAFLKILQWNTLRVIVSLKEQDFLNPDFLEIYDFVSKLEERVCSNTYTIDFSFLDYSEKVNEKNLHADGYILKLKGIDEARARRA